MIPAFNAPRSPGDRPCFSLLNALLLKEARKRWFALHHGPTPFTTVLLLTLGLTLPLIHQHRSQL